MKHAFRHFFEHHHRDGRGGGRHHQDRARGFGQRLGGLFGGGGGVGGGAGMRAAKMLASGDLQLVILALLQDKARYGYEIIKALEEHSSGVYTPSPGMVYPALTYLEEVGHTNCTLDGKKKLYNITEEGSSHLAANRAAVDETLAELARFGRRISEFQKQMSDEEQTTEHFGRGTRGHTRDWRELKTEFRDLKQELREAIFEKLDAPMEEKRRILDVLRQAINDIRNK